jgi:hypothetical protein
MQRDYGAMERSGNGTYQEKQEVKLGGTAGPNSPTARDERKSKGTKGNCS